MTGCDSWSTTPLTNSTADGGAINWAENQAPSTVNNTARQLMADVRAQLNNSPWFQYGTGDQGPGNIAVPALYASGTSFTILGADVSSAFHYGRALKAVGTATGTIYGFVASSSYNSGNSTTTVNATWWTGTLSNEALVVSLSQIPVIGAGLGRSQTFINVLSLGASPNATGSFNTGAFREAIASGLLVYAPGGTYTIDDVLDFSGSVPGMIGDGRVRTFLQTTANSNGAISLGATGVAAYMRFTDFGILGTSSNPWGIKIGSSATNYAARNIFENLYISGFSKSGGYGVYLQCLQETEFHNCVINNNDVNVYRPDTLAANGFLTTTAFTGAASNIGRAAKQGFLIDGEIATLTIGNVVIDSCGNDAIKINTSANNANGNSLVLDGTYFEDNNLNGTGGAEISIAGPTAANDQVRLMVRDIEFHPPSSATSWKQFSFDYVIADIRNVRGLDLSICTTTANTMSRWEYNAFVTWNAADARTLYRSLLGAVMVRDKDQGGGPYRLENGMLHYVAAGAPGSGTFFQGDTLEFAAKTSGGFFGMVCTTGGTPGTWKNYGAIA